MPQAFKNFSNDEVRQIFSRASSVGEAKVAGTLEELERHISQWTFSCTGLKSAIEQPNVISLPVSQTISIV
jgi:hypothetical protein